MTPKQVERLEKTLGRVAREQGLDQERLRRWVSFLALCGVLESAVEKGVIDIYYLKGGVAMELRFARAARTTKDFDLGLRGNRAERIRRLSEVLRTPVSPRHPRLTSATHLGIAGTPFLSARVCVFVAEDDRAVLGAWASL